jgi:hypothetical protein
VSRAGATAGGESLTCRTTLAVSGGAVIATGVRAGVGSPERERPSHARSPRRVREGSDILMR